MIDMLTRLPETEIAHDLTRYCEAGSDEARVRADQPLSAAIDARESRCVRSGAVVPPAAVPRTV